MGKRLSMYLFVFCCTCLTSCITDSGGDGGSTRAGANVSASAYVPLKNGATYLYERTFVFLEEGSVYTNVNNHTTTVGEQVMRGGKHYYPFVEDDDSTFVRIADNTLFRYGYFTEDYDPELGECIWSPTEVPTLNFGANTWTILNDSPSNVYETSKIVWTGKYLGRETVTVPAGTFNNCIVFELIRERGSYVYLSGTDGTKEVETTTTLWYAIDVGMVKSHMYVETYIGSMVYSWDDYTTELISYNIP